MKALLLVLLLTQTPETITVRISATEVRTVSYREAACIVETSSDQNLRLAVIHALGLKGDGVDDLRKGPNGVVVR